MMDSAAKVHLDAGPIPGLELVGHQAQRSVVSFKHYTGTAWIEMEVASRGLFLRSVMQESVHRVYSGG
jgi:hypothetical protein